MVKEKSNNAKNLTNCLLAMYSRLIGIDPKSVLFFRIERTGLRAVVMVRGEMVSMQEDAAFLPTQASCSPSVELPKLF